MVLILHLYWGCVKLNTRSGIVKVKRLVLTKEKMQLINFNHGLNSRHIAQKRYLILLKKLIESMGRLSGLFLELTKKWVYVFENLNSEHIRNLILFLQRHRVDAEIGIRLGKLELRRYLEPILFYYQIILIFTGCIVRLFEFIK